MPKNLPTGLKADKSSCPNGRDPLLISVCKSLGLSLGIDSTPGSRRLLAGPPKHPNVLLFPDTRSSSSPSSPAPTPDKANNPFIPSGPSYKNISNLISQSTLRSTFDILLSQCYIPGEAARIAAVSSSIRSILLLSDGIVEERNKAQSVAGESNREIKTANVRADRLERELNEIKREKGALDRTAMLSTSRTTVKREPSTATTAQSATTKPSVTNSNAIPLPSRLTNHNTAPPDVFSSSAPTAPEPQTNYDNKLRTLQAERDALQARVQKLNDVYQSLERRIPSVSAAELVRMEQKAKSAEGSVRGYREKLTSAEETLKEAQREVAGTRLKLKTAERRVHDMKKDTEEMRVKLQAKSELLNDARKRERVEREKVEMLEDELSKIGR